MRYHLKFQHIKPATIAATRTLIKDWSTQTPTERWLTMDAWITEVSAVYSMRRPVLVFDPFAGSGFYRLAENEIHMSKASIVTLLHEFRHAMQCLDKAGRWVDAEKDARAWSLSLYWQVAPRTLKRLVRAGEILHTTIRDFER